MLASSLWRSWHHCEKAGSQASRTGRCFAYKVVRNIPITAERKISATAWPATVITSTHLAPAKFNSAAEDPDGLSKTVSEAMCSPMPLDNVGYTDAYAPTQTKTPSIPNNRQSHKYRSRLLRS